MLESKCVMPDKTAEEYCIKIFQNDRGIENDFGWMEVDSPDNSHNAMYVEGIKAFYMLGLLRMVKREPATFAKYYGEPDCHGAAMIVAEVINYIKPLSPQAQFKQIYAKHPAAFTYDPQEPPVLVHLLNKRLDTVNPLFSEENTPHSVVMIGGLNGEEVCFHKRGMHSAEFATFESIEKLYNTTERLYVKTLRG